MNRFYGNAAFWYAEEHEVPIYKIDNETGKSTEIWLSEAKNLLDKSPEVLIWCNVQETMVPVPLPKYIAMGQFTVLGTNCPTPEFKHGQVVLDTKTWSRGKISSITLDAKRDFQYKVIFFGQTQEYTVESELLREALATPHPREVGFPVGTKIVYEETTKLGSYLTPGVVRKIRYDEKEGVWEHQVQFLNCTKWVDSELSLWNPEKFENTGITEEDFKFFEQPSSVVDSCTD